MKEKIRKKIPYILLAVWLCILTAVSFYIVSKSKIAWVYDERERVAKCFLLQNKLLESNPLSLPQKAAGLLILSRTQSHPQLFEVTGALCWHVLKKLNILDENKMVLITDTLFLGILIFSTFGIGSLICNPSVGLLSSICLSLFPLVFGHSRIAMLDFPMMCLVTLSIFLLLKTESFRSLKYSILFGVSLGLSQLTKEAAFLFFFAPVLYYFFRAYAISVDKKRTLRNFYIALAFFILTAGCVYLNPSNLFAYIVYFKKVYYLRYQPEGMFYIVNARHAFGSYVLALSLPLLLSHALHFKKRNKLLIIWLIVPLCLFSISANKALRFLLPIMPAFILMVFYELYTNSFFASMKKVYGFAFLSFSLMQYVLLNAGYLDAAKRENHLYWGLVSVKEDKYMEVGEALLEVFKKEARTRRRQKIYFLFNIGQIHSFLSLQLSKLNLPFMVFCSLEADSVDKEFCKRETERQAIESSEYVVYHDARAKNGSAMEVELHALFMQCNDKFKQIAETAAFDGSKIVVYKRNPKCSIH